MSSFRFFVLQIPSPKRFALLLFIVVPVAAWIFVKPMRVIAPMLVGISCREDAVCVDRESEIEIASRLRSESIAYVSETISPMQGAPRMIFCKSQECADKFGLGARSAFTVGKFGTVIGPNAWHSHYVRHEVIHYLQVERLGTLSLLLKPSWFVEGMAYSLSQDPRAPLSEPFEAYRKQFTTWYGALDKQALWREAEKL